MIGLDLGTVHLGVVVAGDALPLYIRAAETFAVNRDDLDATARGLRALVDRTGDRDVVVEMGSLYIPADATPQKARAIADNHATMRLLLARIWESLPGPFFRVDTIARRTWTCRVIPHHANGITDAEANVALASHVDPSSAWPRLADSRGRLDQHRADACGAVVGYLLGAAQRAAMVARVAGKPGRKRGVRKPRPTSPRVIAQRAQDAAADALLAEQQARLAAGPPRTLPRHVEPSRPCGCGARGPHRRGCRAPAAKVSP